MKLDENVEDYNPTNERRALIVFDNMTADMESNKKLSPIIIPSLKLVRIMLETWNFVCYDTHISSLKKYTF